MVARRLTAVFAKRPRPGEVKTRLSPPLAPAEAARLQEAMLADALERCAAAEAFRTTLVFAPASEAAWFRARFPAPADQRPQEGLDLATRLARFTTGALADPGIDTVVVIGSDQPLVGAERIVAAHAALEDGADLVLGPDAGGGYYLAGLRAPAPYLFTEVQMSTAGMFAATMTLAEARGLDVALLPEDLDVDVAADLERLRAELAGRRAAGADAAPDFPRRTWEALALLHPSCP